jgi:hypothetical protein
LLCLWAGKAVGQVADPQSGAVPDGYHWPIHYDGPQVHHGSAAAAGQPPLPHFHLTFHGGPVQTTTKSYAIYWKPKGSFMNAGYQTIINQFLDDVGGSPLYGFATEYTGSNGPVKNQSKFSGSWVDETPFPKWGLTDLAITQTIERAVLNNGWDIGIGSSFFLMLGNGAIQGPQFCAYHSAFQFNYDVVIYGVMPYFTAQDAGGCGSPFGITPNNNFDADSTIGNLTHEQMEMVTDPLLNAWYDPINGEVGDICIYSYGVPYTNAGANFTAKGHGYIVQEEWSEKFHGCQPSL